MLVMLSGQEMEGSIHIKVDGEFLDVPLRDIVFVESFGNYVKVVTVEKTYLTPFTTKRIEVLLPEPHFIRIHKSYIVNKHCILRIDHDSVLVSNLVLPIGKTYKQYFVKMIAKDHL
jgi:DNA-binding LytR/AlgR family response regulator